MTHVEPGFSNRPPYRNVRIVAMKAERIRRAGLVAVLGGLALFVLGPMVDVARPHFMLDVVLSPAQLQDGEFRKQTLTQLQLEQRLHWTLSVAGLVLVAVGGVGLCVHRLQPRTQPKPFNYSNP